MIAVFRECVYVYKCMQNQLTDIFKHIFIYIVVQNINYT